MDATPFSVALSYRPRRVLFLVDAGLPRVEDALDAILAFNVESWGGRHNPILLTENGDFRACYEPVVACADPDIVYVLGGLSEERVDWLNRGFAPLDVVGHDLSSGERVFMSSIDDQAPVDHLLNDLPNSRRRYLQLHEPKLLHFDYGDESRLLRPFRWNIGYAHQNEFAIRDYDVKGVRPDSVEDEELLRCCMAVNREIAWNVRIAADAPSRHVLSSKWRALSVFVGDDLETRTNFWNDALVTGSTRQIWIPMNWIQDEKIFANLCKYLSNFQSSGSNEIRFVSFSLTQNELDDIAKRMILASRTGAWASVSSFSATEPAFGERKRHQLQGASREYSHTEYVAGMRLHLPLRSPGVSPMRSGREARLMVDARVEDPHQEVQYANRTSWWRMPVRGGIHELFDEGPHRVISNGELSFEITASQPSLRIVLPTRELLFQSLLAPEPRYRGTNDLRRRASVLTRELHRSEVSRYLNGILSLSPGWRDTFHLFENPFWRDLLATLAKSQPNKLQMAKLVADARRKLNHTKNAAMTAEWVSDRLVLLAQQFPARRPMSYEDVRVRFVEYLQTLEENDRNRARSNTNLLEDFNDLVGREIAMQGVELRCTQCFGRFWYSIREIDRRVVCRGCAATFSFQAEAQWSYRLNELVREGIASHGIVPLVRTMLRLFHEANETLMLLGPSFIEEHDADQSRRVCEIDLAWIIDGRFGFGEVKANTSRFERSDLQHLYEVAIRAHPDELVLAAPSGSDAEIEKAAQALGDMGLRTPIKTWGPSAFDKVERNYR
jgi:hypothetical protein